MKTLAQSRLTRRAFIQASGRAVASMALWGCGGASPAPGGPVPDSSRLATVNIGTTGVANGIVDIEGLTHHHQPEMRSICHCGLSQYDHDYNVIPMLAERLPSIDDGTWVVRPDGTMQLTWHLRRGVRWHDGHPFTSSDVRFSWEFNNDRSLPVIRRPLHTNVVAMDTPDENTVVMHWKTASNLANVVTLTDLFIYPEHVVRPLWESGLGERSLDDEFFHHRFVGLGSYRLARWTPDESLVFKPFDDFFLGKPRIGTVIVHQLESSQAILTRLLAGQLQMATSYGLTFDDALVAQEQWEAKGEGQVLFTPVSLQRLILKPANPLFRDVRVRQALLHAIDRDELNAVFFRGQAVIANTLLHPREAGYAAADAVVAKYSFDPARALALMEAAGWRRGADGVLANALGERFEIVYRVSSAAGLQQRIRDAIANYWKEIGVRTVPETVADALTSDSQERASFLGVTQQGGGTTVATLLRRWHSAYIPRAETRFIGDNLQHWNNPEADSLLDRIDSTFDQRDVERLLVRLASVYAEDLPALPLYYDVEPVAIHRSLKNARPRPNSSGQHSTTWSVYQWEWS